MTNVTAPNGKLGPMGQFTSLRSYPSPSDKEVTAPNADTLYSLAWLDLAKEPYVLYMLDEDDRYFLMPMLSGWTNVFEVPGKRTTCTKAQKYVLTGPGWKGMLPEGITEYKSPTSMVWILGRTYAREWRNGFGLGTQPLRPRGCDEPESLTLNSTEGIG